MLQRLNQSRALTFSGLSQAVRAGDLVVLSGQVALDDEGELVGPGDASAQAAQVFRNIDRLLELAGASHSDVVKLTCYLTDAAAYPAYAQEKLERFPAAGPAGTALVVGALMDPRFLMEVEAIAVVHAGE